MAIHLEAWPAGAPCWVDLSVSDPDATRAFYGEVLGWEFTESSEEFGGYFMALVEGQPAAGLAPPMPGMEETPHVWTTYLGSHDIDAVAAAVTKHGGTVAMPPMQLESLGSMGIFLDSTGAGFGVWQYGDHTGFNVTETPGSVAWSEAMVGDFEAGKSFYANVFDYTYQDISAEGMRYAMFSVPGGDQPSGGLGQADEGQPPYWSVTFNVADLDATLQRAKSAGSKVIMEPFVFEFGRIAVITGPDGESFGVIEPPAQEQQS